MTAISIPISVPGAGESANALNRAADAVEKLAKGMERERVAAGGAATETKRAAQAANELAAAEHRAEQAMGARTRATAAAHRQDQAIGGGNSSSSTKWGRLGGMLPMLGGSIPGAGGVISGMAGGGAMASIAAGAAVIGVGLSAASSYIRKAEEAAANIAKGVIALNKGFRSATDELEKRGGAVSDANGSLMMSAMGKNGNAVSAARKSINGLAGVSMTDALTFEKLGLNDTQKKAASMAAVISGRSAGDVAAQISKGNLQGANASQIASLALSNSGSPTNPGDVDKQYSAATSGASSRAVLDRVRTNGLAGIDSLGTLDAGAAGARADRGAAALASNPQAAAEAAAFKDYQATRAQMGAEADAEWGVTGVMKNIGTMFGGSGSKSNQVRKLDIEFSSTLFSGAAPGQKILNGAAR